LGSETLISLAEARKRCLEVRTQVEAGLDPIRERIKNQRDPVQKQDAQRRMVGFLFGLCVTFLLTGNIRRRG
jgi:hypothetical protein